MAPRFKFYGESRWSVRWLLAELACWMVRWTSRWAAENTNYLRKVLCFKFLHDVLSRLRSLLLQIRWVRRIQFSKIRSAEFYEKNTFRVPVRYKKFLVLSPRIRVYVKIHRILALYISSFQYMFRVFVIDKFLRPKNFQI